MSTCICVAYVVLYDYTLALNVRLIDVCHFTLTSRVHVDSCIQFMSVMIDESHTAMV